MRTVLLFIFFIIIVSITYGCMTVREEELENATQRSLKCDKKPNKKK